MIRFLDKFIFLFVRICLLKEVCSERKSEHSSQKEHENESPYHPHQAIVKIDSKQHPFHLLSFSLFYPFSSAHSSAEGKTSSCRTTVFLQRIQWMLPLREC